MKKTKIFIGLLLLIVALSSSLVLAAPIINNTSPLDYYFSNSSIVYFSTTITDNTGISNVTLTISNGSDVTTLNRPIKFGIKENFNGGNHTLWVKPSGCTYMWDLESTTAPIEGNMSAMAASNDSYFCARPDSLGITTTNHTVMLRLNMSVLATTQSYSGYGGGHNGKGGLRLRAGNEVKCADDTNAEVSTGYSLTANQIYVFVISYNSTHYKGSIYNDSNPSQLLGSCINPLGFNDRNSEYGSLQIYEAGGVSTVDNFCSYNGTTYSSETYTDCVTETFYTYNVNNSVVLSDGIYNWSYSTSDLVGNIEITSIRVSALTKQDTGDIAWNGSITTNGQPIKAANNWYEGINPTTGHYDNTNVPSWGGSMAILLDLGDSQSVTADLGRIMNGSLYCSLYDDGGTEERQDAWCGWGNHTRAAYPPFKMGYAPYSAQYGVYQNGNWVYTSYNARTIGWHNFSAIWNRTTSLWKIYLDQTTLIGTINYLPEINSGVRYITLWQNGYTGGHYVYYDEISFYEDGTKNYSVLYVDANAPTINLISPANHTYSPNTTNTFTCSITDQFISNLTLYVWNASNVTVAQNTTILSGTYASTSWINTFPEGVYIWNCLGYDTIGHSAWANNNFSFGVDMTAPTISNLSPANNTYLNPNNKYVVYLETFEGDTSEWTANSFAGSTKMNLSYSPAIRGSYSVYGKSSGDDVYKSANSTAAWISLVDTSNFFVFARVNFSTMDNGRSGIHYNYNGFRYRLNVGSDVFQCENENAFGDFAYTSPTPNTIYSIMMRYRASNFTVEVYDSTTSLGNCTMTYDNGPNDGLLTEEDGMTVDDYCVGRGAEAPISEVYQSCANSGDYINAVEFTVTMNDSMGVKNASFTLQNGSISANPYLYYTLNDVLTDSLNRINATMPDGALTYGSGISGNGTIHNDKRLKFVGTDALDWDNNDWSWNIWLNATSIANDEYILSNSMGGTDHDYSIEFYNNRIYVRVGEISTNTIKMICNTTISTNTWNMISLARDVDSNTAYLYQNGMLCNYTSNFIGTMEGGDFVIGGYYDFLTPSWDGYQGKIDEVGMWFGNTLTSNDVSYLYNNRAVYPFSILATVYTANYSYVENTTSIEQTTWLTGLLDGIYTWWYDVWDWAGNLFTSETRTLTIDTIYPSGINILYPVYETYYNSIITDLNFSYSDDINTRDCWYSYDGGATNSSNVTCANYTGLTASQGWNSWTIYVRDKAMNTNYSTVLFYVDTVAPTVSDLSPVDEFWSDSSTINFNANISDNVGIKNSTLIVSNTTTTYYQSSFDYSGLVSYWSFDTDATDSFGLNDGTVTGATHYDTGGVVGGYYKIDSGNYICFPNAAEYNFSKDTPFTISLWMNTTFVSAGGFPDSQIFGKQENSGTYNGWNIIQQDGNIFNYMNDVSGNSIIRYTEESKINYGGWVHWVYTYNASTKTVQDIVNYVNGTAIYNSVLDDTIVDTVWNDAQLCIAIRDGAGFGGWVGAVDEIGIWNRALSATDVNSLFTNRQNAYQAQTSIRQNKELSGMPDGDYTWTYGAYDYSGNSGGGSYIRLYVDTTAPTITLISPADTTYSATAANNFTCSISDLYVANLTLYVWNSTDNLVALNATSISGSGSTTWLNSFADGTYRWNCLGYDYIGHSAWATANYSVTIDTTAPVITNLSPEDNYWSNSSTVNFSVAISDNIGIKNSTLTVSNSGGIYNQSNFSYIENTTSVVQSQELSSIPDGTYDWSYSAYDYSGNSNSSENTIYIDANAPVVTLISPANHTYSRNTTNIFTCNIYDLFVENMTIYLRNSTNDIIFINTTVVDDMSQPITETEIYFSDIFSSTQGQNNLSYVNMTSPQTNEVQYTWDGSKWKIGNFNSIQKFTEGDVFFSMGDGLEDCGWGNYKYVVPSAFDGNNLRIEGIYTERTAANNDGDNITIYLDLTSKYSLYVPNAGTGTLNVSVGQVSAGDVLYVGVKYYGTCNNGWINFTNLKMVYTPVSYNYSAAWTTELSEGRYTWNCLGYDYIGHSAWSTTSDFILDVLYPNITVIIPTNNSYLPNDSVNITVNISDTIGVKNATLYINGIQSSEQICYQESANTSNQTGIDSACGLNYNGVYGYNNTGIFLINYSKPSGATNNSVWSIKSGTGYINTHLTQNLSLPNNCVLQNVLSFKINESLGGFPSGTSSLEFYCFNGTDWQLLINYSAGYVSGSAGCSGVKPLQFYDGDWNTGQVIPDDISLCSVTMDFGNSKIDFFEEAMFWKIDLFTNQTTYEYPENTTSVIQGTWFSGLLDGVYVWWYDVWDWAGHFFVTEDNVFTVDTIYPSGINILYPVYGTYYNVNVTMMDYSYSDINIKDCWYSLNGGATNSSPATCTNFTGLSVVQQGWNYWTVYVRDKALNTNSSTVLFYMDLIAPTVTLLSPSDDLWTTQTELIFNATITDNVGVHNSTFSIYNTTTLYNQTIFSYVPSGYCYQESANDTSCGASAGGYYEAAPPYDGTWYDGWDNPTDFSAINDMNWDTYKNVTGVVGDTVWNYVNYTIPEGADVTTSFYQIKNETGIYNISLTDCVDSDGRLSLRFSTKPFVFRCYNNSNYYGSSDANWTIIARMGNVVYEEAMWWNIGTLITQSISLSSIPDGNYKWTYNVKDWSANSFTANNYTINIDTTNPVTILSQPANNEILPAGSYSVTFGCNLTDMRLANTTLYVWNNTQGLIIANTTTYTTETSATPTWTNTLLKDGYFNYTCETYDYLGHSSMPSNYQFLLTPQVFFLNSTNGANDSNSSPYQIGSLVYFNTTLNYASIIDTCSLVINDTGLWHNTTYQSVNASNYNLSIPYTITSISIKNASHVGWRIWCNNSEGNSVESDILVFYVNDFTLPTFTFGSNNSFTDNRTILNNKRENLTLSIGFFDYNLFAVEVNISCDKNESLYYFSVVDLNSSLYNLSATVSIYNQQPQKCNVLLSATDDHTDKDIPNYNIKAKNKGGKNKGLSIEPPENSNVVDVLSQDEDYDSVSTTKQKDRYNFEFKYKEKALQRSFEVITNNDLYYREASYYPAHFVVWDSNKKVGTWLDFNEEEREKYIYSVARISDDTYNVTVTAIVPEGISPEKALKDYGFKKLKFKSIGGTNMYNASYVFWIGADINMTSKNLYDNQSFTNWSAYIYRPSDGWNRTVDANSSSTVYVALSNDTYNILFYHQPAHYFNQTSSVVIGDGTLLQNVWYNSSQAIINYYAKRIYFNDYVTGFYTRLTGGVVHTNYTGLGGNVSTFYANASTYSYLFYKDANYSNVTGSTTVTYLENKTVIIDVPFNFNFNLIDERTGLPFNVSNPDDIKLVEFCPTNTVEYDISSSSAVVPLVCQFTKIKFVLYYATTSYFRTVILEMSPDVDSEDIYLIDLSNTDYIYNTFRLDDLFSDYEEPSVWFKKNVAGGEVLIHSDFADIENKVGAYLISNHEYNVEVHSTNKPIFVLGSYSADIDGEKILRLWGTQLNASWEHNTVANALYISAGVMPNTDIGYFFYNDFSNLTTNVDVEVINGSVNGNVVYSATFTVANGSNAIDYLFNISQFQSERYPLYLKANITTGVGSVIPWLKQFWSGNVSVVLGEDLLEELNLGFGITEDWMDIFFVALLCILALYATAFNQRAAAIGLIIITAGIISFGWLNLAGYILVVVAILWLMEIVFTRYHKR